MLWALLLAATPLRPIAPGIEYGEVPLPQKAKVGASTLHVVRIDPKVAKIGLEAVALEKGGNRTAGRWCEDAGAVAAINAGMYHDDHVRHVGFFRVGGRTLTETWNGKYQSLLTIDAAGRGRIVPRTGGPFDAYPGVVQNLRLIKHPGENVWSKQKNRWSEAAIAEDAQGRILFLFARSPYSMWRFNQMLLALDLGIVAAQHAEGGPEASLSIRAPGLSLDLAGSYETDFNENDGNAAQWRIPNVLVAYAGR